jgi:cation diffusion facilitator family transporter
LHGDPTVEKSEQIGLLSIGINVFLVVLKSVLAMLSGSVALLADAIHSLSDVVSAATVFAGIKISKRTSKAFPYGLYKVENFVSLISSLFILFAGYGIVRTVFVKDQSLYLRRLPLAILGVIGTMVITFLFSRYELRQGKAIGTPSLVADAQHIKADMLSSAVILVGLIGSSLRLPLDKVAALVVVFFVGRAGIGIFLDSIRVLLDASLDFETLDIVKNTILSDPQVDRINGLWGRNSGRFKFIEADISLRMRNLEKAHLVSRRIEENIKREVSHVDHILIHYEPLRKETQVCAIPLEVDKKTVSLHFGDAPVFYLATIKADNRTILEEKFLKNPYLEEEKGKGIKVSEWLIQQGTDSVFIRKEFRGKGPSYVFSDGGVDVHLTASGVLEDAQREMEITDR